MEAGRRGRWGKGRAARLRRWLLAGFILLLLVLAGLLGYARYRARRLFTELPHRLGIDIKSETNGFTYSQSSKGRTLFTLHAAKAIQRENGKTTLHDVAITLYGPAGSNQTDSIRGEEFEYDQTNGVVRAAGEVHLDLATPAPSPQAGAKPDNSKRISVTTSGLVFLQKLGVAATDQPLTIDYGDLHGGATGADYDSDSGTLNLRNAVHMDGVQDGTKVHLQAASGVVDRTKRTALLHAAHVQTDGNRAAGDSVLINLGKDRGIDHVHAEGHASLESEDGTRAQASTMDATMGENGKLHLMRLVGAVEITQAGGTGHANEATVHFSAAGVPTDAEFEHAVRLEQGGAGGTHSTLTADRVVSALMPLGGKHVAVRDATATGSALLRSVQTLKPVGGDRSRATLRTTIVSAAVLHAVTADAGAKRYVSSVTGTGGTRIEQSDDTGALQASTGDSFTATLLPPGKAHANALQTLVQTGHVVVAQHTPAREDKKQPAQDSRATAARAEYDGTTARLLLTGSPVVTSPGVQLAADRISLLQGDGSADAQGNVRGTFVQAGAKGSADPVHVLAERANILHAGAGAQFFAGAKPARMWTATSQLDAAEIDLDRAKGLLSAASAKAGAPSVHLTLPAAAASPGAATGAVRITGQTLKMAEATVTVPGHAEMTGSVRLVGPETQLSAERVVATLAGGAKPAAEGTPMLGGNVQSIVATENVHLQQPGRTGTGDKLVYTAADRRYELTGSSAAPPRIVDSLRGVVTGTSLIFHGADDSVEVSGEAGRRVRTETDAIRPERH